MDKKLIEELLEQQKVIGKLLLCQNEKTATEISNEKAKTLLVAAFTAVNELICNLLITF